MDIDFAKVAAYRREWLKMAQLYEAEAERRREKAKVDAKKFYATHMQAAKEADKDAAHFRGLLKRLAEIVAENKKTNTEDGGAVQEETISDKRKQRAHDKPRR